MPGVLDYSLERTVAPTLEPITLEAAKHQCSIELDETAFDAWFESREGNVGAIQAAREMVESAAQIVMMPQTWTLRFDQWPGNASSWTAPWNRNCPDSWAGSAYYGAVIDLMVHPVASITSVTYADINGDQQTWDSSNYELVRSRFRSLLFKPDSATLWPIISFTRLRSITITFVAGYPITADDTDAKKRARVPATAKHAMHVLLAHWFKNRESVAVGQTSNEIEQSFCSLIKTVRPTRYT